MRSRRSVLATAAVAAALALSACGGGDGGDTADVSEAPSDVPADSTDGVSEAAPEQPTALLPSQLDLIGETVLPASDIESNLLPPVVVDDLSADRKVNVRNLVPRELPVLVWMWAPN